MKINIISTTTQRKKVKVKKADQTQVTTETILNFKAKQNSKN